MNRLIDIALCLCLLLCCCASSFSVADGSVLDKEFIESFPFQSKSFSTVVNWFKEYNNYKIKETDELNNSIYVNYRGNVA